MYYFTNHILHYGKLSQLVSQSLHWFIFKVTHKANYQVIYYYLLILIINIENFIPNT